MENGLALMSINNYEEIYELWCNIPGLCISCADSKDAIAKYLERNQDMSFVFYIGTKIVGTILCGNDGRRGYIHHACVHPEYQGKGIGKKLVEASLGELKKQGIAKCHLFVLCDNIQGIDFWDRIGWEKRNDIYTYSKDI